MNIEQKREYFGFKYAVVFDKQVLGSNSIVSPQSAHQIEQAAD